MQSCRYVIASVLARQIPWHSLYWMNTVIWNLILIRNAITTAWTRWCCMPSLILQLSLYFLVVKSVLVAVSSRKFHNMSNGVRADNVRRAGSKSQFCSSPLILRFTYAVGWQMTQCAVQAASLFLGHPLHPRVKSGSVPVWLILLHT